MSIKLMSQVWELELDHGEKLVLLALADHADDEGYCFPSIRRIAWKTDYSRRAVQRIIRSLEGRALVVVAEEAPGTPGKAREYLLCPENGDQKAPFNRGVNLAPVSDEGATSETETGDISNKRGDISSATGVIAVAPESSLEPSSESSYKHQRVFAEKEELPKRQIKFGNEVVEQVLHNGCWRDSDAL